MKIAVIGAGAMGSLFGALLAEAGSNVWLVDVWKEHVAAVNERGLIFETKGKQRTVKIRATLDPAEVGSARLVIVFVKSTHTAAASRTAALLAGTDGTVLTLQNGMGNAELLAAAAPAEQIVVGTTSHGATLLGPGHIRHAGKGPTVIGPWSKTGGGMNRAKDAAAVFNEASITTEVVEEVLPVLWNKLIINVGINAITALTGIKNGQLLDLEATRHLSAAAVEEAMAVARAQGVSVREDAVDHVLAVAEATAANRSSMGQDVDQKRTTEIDAINGYVVRSAEALGLAVPVNRTLTALIQTLQAHYA
ncbi:MAG: 2-dehydropantoate 2-reductase [Deltaproteobacteria bacterium]|nr:2-dehydropantoate 2-reductase [Deltaproteobacteria bacterium]MBW2042823.1 2-dehydropantoate 2-reductase [Deltaproteobacteria bacterium]